MSATRRGSPRTPSARGPGGEAKTAFVLSGSGSLAAMQAGMPHALYERGIFPDLLVATSAGALNAAFIASRPQTVTTARELRRVWRNLQREDIFPVIPLHLVAVDLIEGREVLLSEGPAVETIVAAASIPGVFPPVEIADRRLIDGGAVNNTPISHAVELGADKIFVLPTWELGRVFEGPPMTALDTAIYGLGVLDDGRLQSDIARYSGEVDIVVLASPNGTGVQPTNFEHSDRLVGQALIAARSQLARHRAGRHLQLVS